MRILVTGANGMLGVDLCSTLAAAGHDVVRTDVAQGGATREADWLPLDVTDSRSVLETVERSRPDAVIHAAAYTNVDGCETDPATAYRVNALGTWCMAAACGEKAIPLTYISTDFVFDGALARPYTEFDAPNPLGHYGASKLAGERLVASLCRRHFIVRTAWLYGVHGKSFPGTMLQLAASRSDLQVVVDQVGSPTYTVDLARALERLQRSTLYGAYHVTNAGQCSWHEFATIALDLAGIKGVTVHAIPASQWPSPTRRPAYSVLRRFALELQGLDDMRPWESALADFVAARASYLMEKK